MEELKKNKQEKKSTDKKASTQVKVAQKSTPKETPKVMKYAAWAYCNILGASMPTRHVAARKYKGEGKKTAEEWKEIFKKDGLI